MSHSLIKLSFFILFGVWTIILSFFWGLITFGGNIVQWLLADVLAIAPTATARIIDGLQMFGSWVLFILWVFGAGILFVLKRLGLEWIASGRASDLGNYQQGYKPDTKLADGGQVIDGSARDISDK